MPVPQAHAAHLAQAVREAIGAALPVFAEGRIESPRVAHGVLAAGQADAVVMTRALISDPALPRKVAGLDDEPLRPHIGMTRYFSVQGDWNRPLGDLSNPRAGRENLLPPVVVGKAPRPALVIGGGAAGMEAAITLARQGRSVTLREGGPELGGMAAVLARAVPARAEFALLVDYQRAMLERLGVRVELEQPVTTWEPAFAAQEALYLAIGAEPPLPTLPAGNLPLLPPRALLAGAPDLPPPGKDPVAVVDGEGGFSMAAAVEWLLEREYAVAVITADLFVGRGLVESAELLWFQRVAPRGARFHPRTLAEGVEDRTLRCRERFSGRAFALGPLAGVVIVEPEVPAGDRQGASAGLLATLRAAHPRVLTLGDARAPRLVGEAIQHAHRTVLLE
jgi:2,4-dienoyl-CoA reductase (NADPH2)